ncbi:type II secretion system secretin GspD [Brevundimonas vesicularis]|uniref:type II secretion system secretin GspD n=1 Tax=Brevundimonas vesicularis TaxID=41276 RepID=UPI0038D4BB7A
MPFSSRRLLGSVLAAVLASQMPAPGLLAMAQERQVLNVQNADIRAFIQDVGRRTGRSFIVDPAVSGTVTVSSPRPLTSTQVFELFLSTLRANGLVVTPTSAGAYRISPAAAAAQGPSGVGAGRFTTEVFTLRHADAAAAAETIRPLVGAHGQVLANASANTVVVADFADNMGRIRALVGRIDVDRSDYQVIALENASAREIAMVLEQVMGSSPMVTVTPVQSSNSIVLRGDARQLERIRGLVADLDGRSRANQDINVIFLEHADAGQLLPVLQQIIGQPVDAAPTNSTPLRSGGLGATNAPATGAPSLEGGNGQVQSVGSTTVTETGQRATIARFPGANALVISGPADLQRTLADVIRRLDVRRQQVLIEAIVVELSDRAVRDLGVQWLAASEYGAGLTNYSDRASPLLPIAGGVASDQLDKDDPLREQLQSLALNGLLGANGFIGGLGGKRGDGLFGFIINAAKTDAGSNLLQTPSIMTLDNEEASFLVGQEVPITTGQTLLDGNSNPFTTTERKDIGVRLTVRPQINAGGSITLTLKQEVSSIDGVLSRTATDLVLDKRELETTLVVDDGDIAVAGGLLDQNERTEVSRVPGLGDLPGIGGLFRSTSRQGGRTNLMVFLRPTIIGTAEQAQGLAADRWGYMRHQQQVLHPDVEPSLDALLRDYMRTQPPAAPAVVPVVEARDADAR